MEKDRTNSVQSYSFLKFHRMWLTLDLYIIILKLIDLNGIQDWWKPALRSLWITASEEELSGGTLLRKYKTPSLFITCQFLFKRTVSVTLCDPQCKDGNARCTMVPLKTFSNQVWIRNQFGRLIIIICAFCRNMICEELSELNKFKTLKTTISFTLLTRKGFRGVVLNQALPSFHEGSLEITITITSIKIMDKPLIT